MHCNVEEKNKQFAYQHYDQHRPLLESLAEIEALSSFSLLPACSEDRCKETQAWVCKESLLKIDIGGQ